MQLSDDTGASLMKLAIPFTLILGSVSLLIALFGGFMFCADRVSQSDRQIINPPLNLAGSVESAQDMVSLKLACISLAQSQDARDSLIKTQTILLDGMFRGATIFSFIWGLLSGAMFIYVHVLLRRLQKR
jgi:hypothetical protein